VSDSQPKRERVRRAGTKNPHYTIPQMDQIVHLFGLNEPRCQEEWNQCASQYNAYSASHNLGWPAKDGLSIKKKFMDIKDSKKPSGDPTCPNYIKKARLLWREFENKMELVNIRDRQRRRPACVDVAAAPPSTPSTVAPTAATLPPFTSSSSSSASSSSSSDCACSSPPLLLLPGATPVVPSDSSTSSSPMVQPEASLVPDMAPSGSFASVPAMTPAAPPEAPATARPAIPAISAATVPTPASPVDFPDPLDAPFDSHRRVVKRRKKEKESTEALVELLREDAKALHADSCHQGVDDRN